MNDKNLKNNQVQVLRAFLCLIIIFYHFSTRYAQIYNIESIFNTAPIVTNYLMQFSLISFFVLSGYYITRRYEIIRPKEKLFYWLKKFLGIYLPYLVSILIIFVFSLTGLYGEERTVSLAVLVQNALFLNAFTGTGYVDGAHWYIFALMCLYLLAFISDFLKKEYKIVYWFIILVISITSLVLRKFFLTEGLISKALSLVNLLLCRSYFPYVFIGLSIYFFDLNKKINLSNALIIIGALLAISFSIVEKWTNVLLIIISLSLITLCICKKMSFIDKLHPLIIIGNSSYAIYLLHQNIGYMLLNILKNSINYYLSIFLVLIIMVAIGIGFHYLVERNIKKVLNSI